jgi:hypothetical protein
MKESCLGMYSKPKFYTSEQGIPLNFFYFPFQIIVIMYVSEQQWVTGVQLLVTIDKFTILR